MMHIEWITSDIFFSCRIKDHNIMVDVKNFFDHPIKYDLIRYENILKIATRQGDDYTTGCFLDYNHFKD